MCFGENYSVMKKFDYIRCTFFMNYQGLYSLRRRRLISIGIPIITWLCDILALLVWHFGPACVTFRPGLCDILALSCVTKASACHHTPILTTGAVYRKFHRSSVSKTTKQLSSNSTESSPIRVIVSELSWPHLNTSIWKVQGIASRAQRPLTTAL